MNTSATDKASPPLSCVMSGGTSATLPQHAAHDDRYHFLHEQSPRELVRAISSEHPATASSKNIEQPRSVVNSPLSSRSSPSTSVLQHQNSSLSFNPLQGLAENLGHMNMESSIVPPEQVSLKPRSRVRELSAPLPSVPPSTPASAVSHRSSFSQSQSQHHHPVTSPSFLRHGSPIFSSPLTELSDSEEVEQDVAELSDSNSIEIISGYVADPFVTGRYKDVRSGSRGLSQSARSSYSTAPSPSSRSANSSGNTSSVVQQATNIPSSTLATASASQTPTPHPLSQAASSPARTIDNEFKSTTGTSDSSFVSSFSKSMSPSRAQPRSGAKSESRLSSESSSPAIAHVPAAEKKSHESQGVPEAKPAQDAEDTLRTPNVYINGLPPHFPDESLYLMTRDFGHVLSVRTFTRCVGEKMSGYGFVLFDSVDSAGRCIETLRKYRNLHPSFSKQVHKIPGTPYASGTITLPPAGSLPSLASQSSLSAMSSFPSMASTLVSSATSSSLFIPSSPDKTYGHRIGESISTTSGSEFGGKDLRDLSFREKMEKLKDERSTNLYMEGLPLTIDDVSLTALVSPHNVVSSRFFQTKLSNPPRMIAFVRLETRAGAEEVIDRLHGRVVRGWNDNGCRISVRFADTNEQRELRRAERLNRGDEEEMCDGAQLSMAHAALLNLRGAEAQVQLGSHMLHQQPQLTHYDLRSPVTLPNSKLSNAAHAGSGFGNVDSFHRLSVGHDVSLSHGGVRPTVHHAAQHYHHMPALPHQSRAITTSASAPAVNVLDAHSGFADRTALAKRNALTSTHHSLSGGGFSTKPSDASQLALLQQQNQLHQLQLLRQMQNAGLDPNYALNNHGLEQTHALMPSADIMANQMGDPHIQVDTSHLPSRQGAHGRQGSLSNVHMHTRSYSKGSLSELSGSASLRSANNDHYIGRHGGNDQFVARHQQQYTANQSPTSPASGYSSHFMRSGADHREGVINSDHRRGSAFEEGEVTLISPALTYASRTPSTLSPATPLFNTFGTPASVPATVPRGKTNVRERDYSRLYKNELRQ